MNRRQFLTWVLAAPALVVAARAEAEATPKGGGAHRRRGLELAHPTHRVVVDDALSRGSHPRRCRAGSSIAHLVEVNVTGAVPKVVRVVVAADVGLPINPKSIEAQLQGAAIDAMSTSLSAGPVGGVAGRQVTTIEGLGGANLHPVQQAWIDEDVAQCGYCQPGQVMAAVSLLRQNTRPTDADIDAAMSDNVCRCGTYVQIRAAIKRAALLVQASPSML